MVQRLQPISLDLPAASYPGLGNSTTFLFKRSMSINTGVSVRPLAIERFCWRMLMAVPSVPTVVLTAVQQPAACGSIFLRARALLIMSSHSPYLACAWRLLRWEHPVVRGAVAAEALLVDVDVRVLRCSEGGSFVRSSVVSKGLHIGFLNLNICFFPGCMHTGPSIRRARQQEISSKDCLASIGCW